MNQANHVMGASVAVADSKPKSRIGHWIRIVVSIISFGFIFPHSFTEDDDIGK